MARAHSRHILVLILAGASQGACDAREPVDQATHAITNGYPDGDDTSTVHVEFGLGGTCTGSLIAPNVVLTARHCVSKLLDFDFSDVCAATFGPPFDPGIFSISTNQNIDDETHEAHAVREVLTRSDVPSSWCGTDRAILVLDQPIAPDEALPLVPRVDAEVAPGDAFSAIGYGTTNESDLSTVGERRREDDLFVECVGTGCAFLAEPNEWGAATSVC